jgi:hypothetical protein
VGVELGGVHVENCGMSGLIVVAACARVVNIGLEEFGHVRLAVQAVDECGELTGGRRGDEPADDGTELGFDGFAATGTAGVPRNPCWRQDRVRPSWRVISIRALSRGAPVPKSCA